MTKRGQKVKYDGQRNTNRWKTEKPGVEDEDGLGICKIIVWKKKKKQGGVITEM